MANAEHDVPILRVNTISLKTSNHLMWLVSILLIKGDIPTKMCFPPFQKDVFPKGKKFSPFWSCKSYLSFEKMVAKSPDVGFHLKISMSFKAKIVSKILIGNFLLIHRVLDTQSTSKSIAEFESI